MTLDRVNEILKSKKFIEYVSELKRLEKNRVFCKHGIDHSLDVARISYIKVLENNFKFSKEVIYAAALLHDLGRVDEYKHDIPHNVAGVKIAKEILNETTFTTKEKNQIVNAILNHRKKSNDYEFFHNEEDILDDDLNDIIKLSEIILSSDKESRNCFDCDAVNMCYWDENKKNFKIKI